LVRRLSVVRGPAGRRGRRPADRGRRRFRAALGLDTSPARACAGPAARNQALLDHGDLLSGVPTDGSSCSRPWRVDMPSRLHPPGSAGPARLQKKNQKPSFVRGIEQGRATELFRTCAFKAPLQPAERRWWKSGGLPPAAPPPARMASLPRAEIAEPSALEKSILMAPMPRHPRRRWVVMSG